jgi:hypothetical protein
MRDAQGNRPKTFIFLFSKLRQTDMTDKNDFGRIIFEHHGALGDMLAAWPAALALFSHFRRMPHYFRTRPAHAPFFAALGASPCPPDLRRELDGLYGASGWPDALGDVLVVRPGLSRRPEVPDDPRFRYLPGVIPGRFDPPRDLYREALADLGIPWQGDWLAVFRDRLGGYGAPAVSGREKTAAADQADGPGMAGNQAPDTILLFPGAGHVKKTWPMKNYLDVAGLLAKAGSNPVFVLGPAELERGLDCGPWPRRTPESLNELMALLRSARAVLGADCGPMHLAGLLGVPGVSIFGPTSSRQWGPTGMHVVQAGLPCAPCAQVTSGDFAPECPVPPPCLTGVTVERVRETLNTSGLPPRTPPGGKHLPRTP